MVPWQKVWNQVSRLLVGVTEMTERSFASLVYLDFFFFFFSVYKDETSAKDEIDEA